jgi:hypothetical protein
LWECKLVQPFWKKIWRLFKNLNIDLPYDLSISFLGTYPKNMTQVTPKALHIHVYCILLTIAKLWKYPRCPTIEEWINNMWYLYTMEYYSAMKKNEILSFAGKWMELENITLNKVIQAQKIKNHMFSLICDIRSRANTTRGLDFDHMMKREHTREV